MKLPWRTGGTASSDELVDIKRRIKALEKAERQPYDDRAVLSAIEDLDQRLRDQTLAIAEGIERVDRSERRVKAVVQRAQRRLEEAGFDDPGVAAEATQLQLDYEGAGHGEGVPPVHGHVDDGGAYDFPEESLPGSWSAADRAALMNRRR